MFKEKKTMMTFLSCRKCYNRIRIFGIIIVAIFMLLISRLVYIQYYKSQDLKDKTEKQYYYEQKLEDRNYKLFDKNGKSFFKYDKKYYVGIDPMFYMRYNFNKNSLNIRKVEYILRNYNKTYLLPDKIKNLDYNSKIKYEIDEDTYERLKEFNDVKGLYIYKYDESNCDKNWNIINVMDSIKNFKDNSLKGKNSLEMTMQDIRKENSFSKMIVDKNIRTKDSFNEEDDPKENLNFRLTMSKDINECIKKVINSKKYESYKDIGVILMESDTGKILSMVNKDDSRPNINMGVSSKNGYFPGSIFKIVTTAAALDNNISYENKLYKRNKSIVEHNNRESMTLKEAVICSSNDIFYQVGEEVGFKNIYKYAQKFGLLDPVLGLNDEVNGKFEVSTPVKNDEVRFSAIGQKIRITPLEAINIANVVVNNGVLVKPYIIDSIVNDENDEIKKINTENEKIIKSSTAMILKNMMIGVVENENGTGKLAKIKDIKVGGKTGTSEYYEVENSKREKHSDGWFVGFFTLNGKEYSSVVLTRDIDWRDRSLGGKNEDGGTTSAPIFADVVSTLKEKSLLN